MNHLIFGNQLVSGGLVLMLTGAVMGLLRQLPGQVYAWLRFRFSVSISISDRDPLFEWTRLWLDTLPYSKRAHNITCSLYRELDEEYSADSRMLFAPSYGQHFFRHKGRFLWLNYEAGSAEQSKTAGVGAKHELIRITMLGTRQAPLRELIGEIAKFANSAEMQKVRAYVSGYGWWRRLPTFRPRELTTVDLPAADETRILAAIELFLQSRAQYTQRGIPYHLNLLLAGLPGTGKTSIASALCGHFGFSLHILNIAGPGMNDDRLIDLVLALPRRSMLLLEDVDAVVPERKQKPKPVAVQATNETASQPTSNKEEETGVTLSGLLNCMDGLTAPDGAVIVMTTNHPELLDAALLRPGRVDVRVNFGAATEEQIRKMARRLCPNRALNGEASKMAEAGYTAAMVQAELLAMSSEVRA